MRHRSHAPRRSRLIRVAAAFVALAAVALLLSPAAADDSDLLRFDSAKPYLFIVLDTSASMAMKMGEDEWAPGGADGPDSRLYQSKQALYNVLNGVDDVHFGFAGFNQDRVHATAKHWLYYNEQELPTSWPIDFPRPDRWDSDGNGSVLTWVKAIPEVDADGDVIPVGSDPTPPDKDTLVSEIGQVDVTTGEVVTEADLLTFGPAFPSTVTNVGGIDRVVAGTCASPLDLADPDQRDRVESLAISPSTNPTWFWVKRADDTRYLLAIRRPGNRPEDANGDGLPDANAQLGQDRLHVRLQLWEVASCAAVDIVSAVTENHELRLNLRLDPELSQFFYVNQETWGAGEGSESTMALWEHSDVFSDTAFNSHPHTGLGWESNYDSGVSTGDPTFQPEVTEDDFACEPFTSCAAANVKPVAETLPADERAQDFGDVIPLDFGFTRKHDLLSRLDPGFDPLAADPDQLGDFRIARLFENEPVGGRLELLVPDEIPLLAADLSPLGRAVTDVRCWLLGDEGKGTNKCKDGMWGESGTPGWLDVACEGDTAFGCRKMFLIVISDGEDNVEGADSNAGSDLDGAAGMRIWALNVGKPSGCNSGGGLHPLTRAGGGECVNVESQERLRQVLESLLGQIRTTARSFASAAVPSVQATVEQKIFLTSFLPFNDASVWKGSVHSFLKPLPVSSTGVPLTELKCDGSGSIAVDDPTQGCHLWDAGELLIEKQYPASGSDFLDFDDTALRRVFYAMQPTSVELGEGEWADGMRLFDPAFITTPGSQAVRFDLWRGLGGISFSTDETDPAVNQTAENNANALVLATLTRKQGTETSDLADPVTHSYLLGDIFHSTPVVIGTPANNIYFADDLYDNGTACDADDGTASGNPGYRCFFEKQQFRRKMLLVGSNDGMLHAFDAGIFRKSGTDHWTGADLVDPELNPFGSFDNGTGKELFAYIPRMVLPDLDAMEPEDTKHIYSVDGTVTVADVFVDPVRQGATFPLAAERQWRTVVVGGLREGGQGYYALDITQPDPVAEDDDLDFLPVTADSGDNDPDTGDFVPVCTADLTEVSGSGGIIAAPGDAGCGPVPFPAVLWEFTDSFFHQGRQYFADEEVVMSGGLALPGGGNARRDLADTWSTSNIGRIRVCSLNGSLCDPTPEDATGDDHLVDKFVAVVGGGMDVANKAHDWRLSTPGDAAGNWLYMIDIETGEAIYKQQLVGAAPSEPAAVDTDADGYLDRIYIGTVAGLLYRVDIETVDDGSGDDALPALAPHIVDENSFVDESGIPPDPDVPLPTLERLPPTVWVPEVVFDANWDGATPSDDPRPIYHRPSVIFDAQSGNYVLAFGTGDREDLWFVPSTPQEERFYVFIDPASNAAEVTKRTEAGLAVIEPDAPGVNTPNLLASHGGWVMRLAAGERVITDAFALSGVTVFSTFMPQIVDGEGNAVAGCEDNTVSNPGGGNEDELVCSKQGLSRIFVVNTTNADGLLFESDGATATRYNIASTFVTNPFAEPGQTKEASSGNEEGEHTADDLSPNMLKVMESLKGLFPPQCKFANYRIDIKTVAADTSLQFIAPVPVCLIESNWKEF